MNKKDIVMLCCVALFSVPGVWAQQPLRLSLDECRKMALAHSEELQKSDNALRQAELDRQIAKTAFLPKFDAGGGAICFPIWICGEWNCVCVARIWPESI